MTMLKAQKSVAEVMKALEHRRESLGLSKRRLALSAGLDPKTVGLIERGERSPTLLTLLLLSSALGANLSSIIAEVTRNER